MQNLLKSYHKDKEAEMEISKLNFEEFKSDRIVNPFEIWMLSVTGK